MLTKEIVGGLYVDYATKVQETVDKCLSKEVVGRLHVDYATFSLKEIGLQISIGAAMVYVCVPFLGHSSTAALISLGSSAVSIDGWMEGWRDGWMYSRGYTLSG